MHMQHSARQSGSGSAARRPAARRQRQAQVPPGLAAPDPGSAAAALAPILPPGPMCTQQGEVQGEPGRAAACRAAHTRPEHSCRAHRPPCRCCTRLQAPRAAAASAQLFGGGTSHDEEFARQVEAALSAQLFQGAATMEDVYARLAQRVLQRLQGRDVSRWAGCGRACTAWVQAPACVRGQPAARSASTTSHCRSGPYLIGIAGVPGGGKSSLAAALVRRLGEAGVPCVNVPMDGYHLSRRQLDGMPDPALAHARRGAEWTFDARAYCDCLAAIKATGGCSARRRRCVAGGAGGAAAAWPCRACAGPHGGPRTPPLPRTSCRRGTGAQL